MSRKLPAVLKGNWTELALRWLLGAIFIMAALPKIQNPAGFVEMIHGYDLLWVKLINLTAVVLPFVELVCGAALILGVYPRAAAHIINLMLFTFMTAIAINLFREHAFDCGCFDLGGNGVSLTPLQLLLRDAVFFAMGLWIFCYKSPRRFCLHESGNVL